MVNPSSSASGAATGDGQLILCQMKGRPHLALLGVSLILKCRAFKQEDEAMDDLARKSQDPLGDLKALMTDNAIWFDGGPNEKMTYAFLLQPMCAIAYEPRKSTQG